MFTYDNELYDKLIKYKDKPKLLKKQVDKIFDKYLMSELNTLLLYEYSIITKDKRKALKHIKEDRVWYSTKEWYIENYIMTRNINPNKAEKEFSILLKEKKCLFKCQSNPFYIFVDTD